MSALGEAISALREAITLCDNVKRLAETLKDVAHEIRDHDRRLTRLEAKWETALELSVAHGRNPARLEDPS